jgi:putative ABC exporter
MIGAAIFLVRRTLANRARELLRRLRRPRYAVAVLLGIGYLVLVFWGHRSGGSAPVPPQAFTSLGSVILALLVAKWWIFGADRTALAFAPAEVQFLLPAPVSRRALLAYKLLRAQGAILLNVAIWTVLLGRGGEAPLGRLAYAAGLWVFFATVFVHRLAVALTRDTVGEHGLAGWRRAWPAALSFAGAVTAAIIAWRSSPPGAVVGHPGGPLAGLEALLAARPLSWVVWPFRLPTLALGADSFRGWATGMAAGLAVVGLHVWWILGADRAFEEAAVEASAVRAARLERLRRQGLGGVSRTPRPRSWLRLSPTGSPVMAIAWKNATRLVRQASPAFLLILVAVFLTASGIAAFGGEHRALVETVGMLAWTWAGMLAVVGPLWIRADLRSELSHLPLLRTWPLAGQQVVAGYVFSSTALLTVLQAALGVTGVLTLIANPPWAAGVPLLATLVPVALLTLGALNTVGYCIQHAGALLYPAWVRAEIRPGGIEAVGQQVLTTGVYMLLLTVASLGPGLLCAGIVYFGRDRIGDWALAPGLLVAAVGLGLEAFLLLDWLGSRFERLDPSSS